MPEPIMQVKNVSKVFRASGGRSLRANNNVSLDFYPGKTLGIIGESGCGKSTLMRMLISLDKPTEGKIYFKGRDISVLKGRELWEHRRHIQMVFQDPYLSINPKMRVRDIICEPLLNFGLIKQSEKDAKARELLEKVELPGDFAGRYPHNMSGGQCQRIGIARAFALQPEIILCDEATAALDVSVQKRIIELLKHLQQENNIAMGFVCHDMALVGQVSDQIAVMYLGNIVELMPADYLRADAKHPYTNALISAVFDLNMDFSRRIEVIQGEVPSPLDAPKGCPFRNRCPHCMERCAVEQPQLKDIGTDHKVACHLFD